MDKKTELSTFHYICMIVTIFQRVRILASWFLNQKSNLEYCRYKIFDQLITLFEYGTKHKVSCLHVFQHMRDSVHFP